MVVGEIARPVGTLVIGGGPGGYTAAARAAELGQEVVLIEADRLGGVCLNVGCIPSKALITAADVRHRGQAFAGRGIPAGSGAVDLAATQKWKDEVVDRLVSGVGSMLSKVEVVSGTARLLDGRRVSVEHDDRVSHFRFDHCILATGSTPITLPGLPVDGERVVDSTGALSLTTVPERMVVVGGGYIGLELGTAYAKLGSTVAVVEATDAIGVGFDPDLIAVVEASMAQLGITVHTATLAHGLDAEGLHVEGPEGPAVLPADVVLVAVGRVPNVAELQLDNAGLALDQHGRIAVDAAMRTANPRIFAIGDLVAGPALAHKASTEGRIAAEVIAGLPSAFDVQVPLIAFTDPELASVGLTEAAARAQGIDVVVGRARFAASGRALTMGQEEGLVKLVVDAVDGSVLGVHIVGPDASDLIAEGVLAVEMQARTTDLVATVHAHPTLAEALHDAALAADRRLERRRPR